jgi:hypothetical protein
VIKIARKLPGKMLINLMKKNVGKLESVVFGGIFEI